MSFSFEELTLRPVEGPVDVAGLTAWLDAQPWAFRDPVAGPGPDHDGWHVSATRAWAARNRAARLARPDRWPLGLRVLLAADRVVVAARADGHGLARGLQVVQRVTREGAWTVLVDWNPAARSLGDPRALFPSDLPDPDALVDDDDDDDG